MLNITSKQEVLSNGIVVKRLYDEGGKLLSEHFHDSIGREVERKQYKDDGTLLCHNLYEYEGAGLKYQRLRSFDPTGKLVMEHESGSAQSSMSEPIRKFARIHQSLRIAASEGTFVTVVHAAPSATFPQPPRRS